MIPRASSLQLREIRDEVRRAAESNWSLRQRFNIRCLMNPDVWVFDSIAVLFGVAVLLIGSVVAACLGIVGLAELLGNLRQFGTPAAELGIASVVALANCVVTAAAFFCFAGGPNKRLHQICLGYPHRDQTLRRYIWTRTVFALIVLPFVSLLQFFAVTELFAISSMNWASGIKFACLQTTFQLSLVLVSTGKWIPCVKQYVIWGLGLAALLIGVYSMTLCNNTLPEQFATLEAAGRFCVTYFSPQAWLSNIWFCDDSHNFLSTSLTCTMIACCIYMGARGFVRVLSAELPDSLDRDFATQPPQETDENYPGRRDQQENSSTTESILRGVDAFEKEASNSGPKTSMRKFLNELYHPECFTKESGIWFRLYTVAASFGLFIPIFIALGSIAACFQSSTDIDCLQTARFVSAAILLVPLLLSLSEFIKADQAALYPISNWSLRWRILKRIGEFAVWLLPIWAALNIAFCWFYQINSLEKFVLIAEPLAMAIACVPIAIAASNAGSNPGPVVRLILLGLFAVVSTLFAVSALLVVLPTSHFLDDAELLLGDSAKSVVRILHLKSLLLIFFAAAWSAVWIAISDYCPFDIVSRGGFAANLNSTRTKQELEMTRR